MIHPDLEMRLLGFGGILAAPQHDDLRRARERQQCLSTPDSDRLKIRNLLGSIKGLIDG